MENVVQCVGCYKTRRTKYVKRNTEVLSCNHCCSRKATSITYAGSVSVALRIQHAMRTRHIVISRLPELYNTYQHYLINGKIFGEKKVIDHKTCVLIFSISFVWNISHPKNIWARCDQKCIFACLKSTRYSCQIVMKCVF